jgi:hypothetical protein
VKKGCKAVKTGTHQVIDQGSTIIGVQTDILAPRLEMLGDVTDVSVDPREDGVLAH